MKRCPACGEENADRARFCHNCATPLPQAEERPLEVRKVVTIVFSDVTGSTELGGRLDPETLRRVMERYFDAMASVIERHGGTVEKFIGDAVMAVFGIPRLHEDDALRAVRAAIGMRETLDALNLDLERDHGVRIAARIGVNSGEVVAGDPSTGQRLVTGDAVNVAARLEQAASPGEILLGESTYRLVRDAVDVESIHALDLKGKVEPVPAYRLTGVLDAEAGHARHLDSPMVGRAKELEMMERALERAVAERTSHLFTLLGPAGVGKSRLVKEFVQGPAAGATLLRGRCLSYGEGITFYPLAEIVQEAARVAQADDLATARSKLAGLLEDAEDRDRIASLVAGLVSWGDPVTTDEAFWGVRKLLEHLARERPVVLVFDDIHWGEPTFLDLIEHLADWTREASLLLVCVARPELLEVRPGWGGGKLNATSILLEPLDAEAASRLVDNLLGRAEIPWEARTRILDAAEGNPLFVEEMLGMLIDDGLLRLEGRTWRAVDDLAQITVPPTIQLLLAARLDRLDAEERAVIERGAVEGKTFHTGAVATLAPETLRPLVPSRLLALARKELIRPDRAEFAGEDAFRFRHLLIRDAAYQAMPKEQRADLHERFAGWLKRAAGERLAEYEEILGHHLEQAYRYRAELGPPDTHADELARDAAAHLLASGERAYARGDLNGARTFIERAAGLSRGVDRARALTLLSELLADLGDFRESFDVGEEAVALADEAADPAVAASARIVRDSGRGQVDPSYSLARQRRDAEAALADIESVGDEEGRTRALLQLALLAFFEGRVERAMRIGEELLESGATLTARDARGIAFRFITAAYFGPMPLEDSFRALERARDLLGGGVFSDMTLGGAEAGVLGMAGRFEEARAAMARAEAAWRELGMTSAEPGSQMYAEMERLAGRLEEAERIFRELYERYTREGETGFNSTICALLAATLCDLGRFDEAEAFVAKSREMGAEDDFATQAEWRMAQARILAHRGKHQDALAMADESIAIVEATEYLVWQGDAHEVRGIVLAEAGRIDDARAAYEEALARYEQKGNLPAAARTRERMATLPRP